MLRWFAGKQIRNAAAVGGNIMTGSPISDLNPVIFLPVFRAVFKMLRVWAKLRLGPLQSGQQIIFFLNATSNCQVFKTYQI